MTSPPRPAPITAAAVLLLFLAGEALVVAAVSLGLACWWVTPADTRPFLSFLGFAAFALYCAVVFGWHGVTLLRGTLESPDTLDDHLRRLALPGLLGSLLAAVFAVVMFVNPSPARPVEKEIAVVSGAALLWANLAALLVARRLLGRHWSRYVEWRAALRNPPADAEVEE